MGEVYKARDSRLDRTVAIKVLPATTALNADLRSRFEREAKAISSLNHPNICTLYDIGKENGIDYLVMEYLEGETLSERIKRGSIDLKEALEIAIQISDALNTAHRQNLVHRDLKPANVILTKSGAKLLDFGLAKLQFSDGVVEGTAGATQTTPLTGTGTIIGTIQYMSPEQLEGQPADARSDIFAFGALLYELTTGLKAFEGKSQASLIAAIMEKDPSPVSQIKPMYPPGLDRLIRKCLEKDPDKRWQSARDLSDELKWIAQSGSQAGVSAAVSSKRRIRFRLAWAVAAVMTLVAAVTLVKLFTQKESEEFARRFSVEASNELRWAGWPQISPDGRLIAYSGQDTANVNMIWIRPINSLQSYRLAGTESAGRPFWSPDSKHLAFFSGEQLKRISVSGGPAQLLGEAVNAADGAWGSNGLILFDGGTGDSIRAISASGGQVTAASTLDRSKNEVYHAWPQFLPDGKHFLFLAGVDSTAEGEEYILKVGQLGSMETETLIKLNSLVKYAPPGHLLYIRDKILLAQKFDPDKLELVGEPIPLTDKVRSFGGTAGADFSVSGEGTLVMQSNEQTAKSQLRWFDRTGRELEALGEPQRYAEASLSPDENLIVYNLEDDKNKTTDLWMYNRTRKVSTRFTFETGNELVPIWTPDGKHVVYSQGVFPRVKTMSKSADGSKSAEEIVWAEEGIIFPTDISPDGLYACNTVIKSAQPDIIIRPLSGDTNRIVIADSNFPEWGGEFSPNGRFVLFQSNESGKFEIYVRRSDGKGGKWQVSIGGGNLAQWSKDGKELFYWSAENYLMSVPVDISGTFEAGTPQKLFKQRVTGINNGTKRWSPTKDGQKFLVVTSTEEASIPTFEVVLNWTKELEERR